MKKDELCYSANHVYREGYDDGVSDAGEAIREYFKTKLENAAHDQIGPILEYNSDIHKMLGGL